MNINFPLILLVLVVLSGALTVIDVFVFAPRRKSSGEVIVNASGKIDMPLWAEYARSFFPILLVVFCLRSFLVEPFRIPSGSLKPTLLVGDFILVNKFIYGLRVPIANNTFLTISHPKQGDIMVFKYPVNPSIDFIKRVIGVPGDHIVYSNKQLTINGHVMPQKSLGFTMDTDEMGYVHKMEIKQEDLGNLSHRIYVRPDVPANDFDVVVPPNQYFMMGDNRDNSEDSRYWGFVPDNNIVGKAFAVWFSWDSTEVKPRFARIGKVIR